MIPPRHCAFVLLCGLWQAGCVIDTVPMPEGDSKTGRDDQAANEEPPTDSATDSATGNGTDPPVANEEWDDSEEAPGFTVNASNLFFSSAPILLVGAPLAVSGVGIVEVSNPNRPDDWSGRVLAQEDGSFSLPLSAETDDAVIIRFYVSDQLLEEKTLLLAAAGEAAVDANEALAGPPEPGAEGSNITASSPDGEGLVTVSGAADTVAAGITVVIANRTSGPARAATVTAEGSFSATMFGESGDRLELFAVEPASSNGGGALLTLFVP